MINEKMQDKMNEQIVAELYSAYLYLSMSGYFYSVGLDGMAHWMKQQAMEEQVHAMKIFTHINDREGRVKLGAIDAPPSEWASPLDAWKAAWDHEKKVSAMINNLVTLSRETNDYAATPILNWFVDEQIEEEAQPAKVVQSLEISGGKGEALLMLDRELNTRTFTMPVTGENE